MPRSKATRISLRHKSLRCQRIRHNETTGPASLPKSTSEAAHEPRHQIQRNPTHADTASQNAKALPKVFDTAEFQQFEIFKRLPHEARILNSFHEQESYTAWTVTAQLGDTRLLLNPTSRLRINHVRNPQDICTLLVKIGVFSLDIGTDKRLLMTTPITHDK